MISYFEDNLFNTNWLGTVIDIDDPKKIGRIKVRVFGKFDSLADEHIPWAYPALNNSAGSASGGGQFSVPKLNSIVSINFDNGNVYHPEYYFNQRISNALKDEIKDSYANAHALIYDTTTNGYLKVFFTEAKGLMLDYKETQINIRPDKSILIQTASRKSVIEILDSGTINIDENVDVNITCKNANIVAEESIHLDCSKNASIKLGTDVTDSMLLGDKFQTYFNTHTHTGNLGAITSPPVTPSTPDHLSKINKIQ